MLWPSVSASEARLEKPAPYCQRKVPCRLLLQPRGVLARPASMHRARQQSPGLRPSSSRRVQGRSGRRRVLIGAASGGRARAPAAAPRSAAAAAGSTRCGTARPATAPARPCAPPAPRQRAGSLTTRHMRSCWTGAGPGPEPWPRQQRSPHSCHLGPSAEAGEQALHPAPDSLSAGTTFCRLDPNARHP